MIVPARAAVAAVVAGVLAAALLPHARAGLGIVLVAVALAAAVATVAGSRVTAAGQGATAGPSGEGGAGGDRALAGAGGEGGAGGGQDPSGTPSFPHPRWAALLGALAVALAAAALLRDAGWVVAAELVGAIALGSIAVSSPRRWRATAIAAVAAPARMPRGLRDVGRAVRRRLPSAAGGHVPALGRGLLLAGALLAVFGALFATGDAAFARIAGDVLPDEVPFDDVTLRLALFALVTALAGGLVLATGVADAPARSPLLRIGRTEWLLALGALNVLFALFVGVQLAVLFGGDAYVAKTAGLTYAQYAREGFAQLVVVGVLTLAVVAAALRWARTSSDARLLRALLASLCVLTLVVLASALHRLGLYEAAFGFTRTRLAAHALLLFGAAMFALVVVALAIDRREWLPRATVLLAAVGMVAFAAGDPDARIASRNVERFEATGAIDVEYLSGLSADAVPALVRLPPALRERALRRLRLRLAHDDDGLAGANVARIRARRALAAAR